MRRIPSRNIANGLEVIIGLASTIGNPTVQSRNHIEGCYGKPLPLALIGQVKERLVFYNGATDRAAILVIAKRVFWT